MLYQQNMAIIRLIGDYSWLHIQFFTELASPLGDALFGQIGLVILIDG